MKKILFISPYSGRAGAEMYLYRFLKNYDPSLFQAMLVTEKHSPLFASLQPKIHYTSMEEHLPILNWKKVAARVGEKLRKREKRSGFNIFLEYIHHQFQPDEWVLNTIIMQKAMPAALQAKANVTSIIHEMPSAYSFISQQGMQSLITQSHRIISNSTLTCAALSTMGRPDVTMQPCFFDPQEIQLTRPRDELRAAIGIEEDEFVLVGSGSQDHNKGIELFMQISESACDKHWKFLWIGAERHTGFNYYLKRYQEKLRKNNNLIFIEEKTSDYYDFVNIADAFLLTSFNESFSMATLETMALGKPILTYDCGGVRDFVTEQSGRILSTRNPKDWLDSICWLQENIELFSETELKNMVSCYSTERQVPNLAAILAGNIPSLQESPALCPNQLIP